MLEELVHAVCVEDMATAQFDTFLFAKLTRVADGAKLFAILTKSVVVVAVINV